MMKYLKHCIALFIVWSLAISPAYAAIAFVASTTSLVKGGTTAAINTTGGTLAVAIAIGDGATSTPSDNMGNTWTEISKEQGPSVCGIVTLWYAKNLQTSSTQTFTTGANNKGYGVAVFSGTDTTNPFDVSTSSAGTTPTTFGTTTPSGANELAVSVAGGDCNTGTIPVINSTSSFITVFGFGCCTTYSMAMAYRIESSAIAVNPTWDKPTEIVNIGGFNAFFKAPSNSGSGEGPIIFSVYRTTICFATIY